MNSADDGHVAPVPVKFYPPNGFGLYEVASNVWEWCADYWTTTWHAWRAEDLPGTQIGPTRPSGGDARVMRGGSFLCHASYCNRTAWPPGPRDPDSSSGNIGFRRDADL